MRLPNLITALTLLLLTAFSPTSLAEIDKFDGLLQNNEYRRIDLYSFEYQHQKPQSICKDYNLPRSECDNYTTHIFYPYHTWQDRVKSTYKDFSLQYENKSPGRGDSSLIAYYMGTYNLSYDVALIEYGSSKKELRTLTFFEFNGADMLALQISYIANVWGNFLNYCAYLVDNERIGFLDTLYFCLVAFGSLVIGILFWAIGWIATLAQFILQPLDSFQSILDADYWSLLGTSIWHALVGVISGAFNLVWNTGSQVIEFLWTTFELVIWMTLGLNLFDGLANIVIAGFEEVTDLLLGITYHVYYTLRAVANLLSFGYIPLPETTKAF